MNASRKDLRDRILVVELDNELLLIDWINRRHFSLNESAALIYRAFVAGQDKEEITRKIVSEYDVDEETAEKDVEYTLRFLQDEGLI